VITKTEIGLQVVKDITEFYRARAKIEDEYAKKLAALYKSPPGAGLFTKDPPVTKEYKTLKEALLAILDKGTKMSVAHQEFANKINQDTCKVLDNWVKNKTNDRTKILTEGQKHLKTVSDAKAAVARHKAEYEKLMKAADAAKEQVLKSEKDEINQPENKKIPPITKKLQQNFTQAKEKAKQQETLYQAAVKKANDDIEANRAERMPAVLESVQKWEEDRWNTLLSSIRQIQTFQATVPSTLEPHNKELGDVVDNASLENDFREFIDANAKTTETEEPFEFIQYKSKFEEEVEKKEPAPAETPPTFSNQTAEEKIAEQPKKEEQKKKDKEEDEVKKEAEKKKTADLKANLFGSDGDDIFKWIEI